MEFKIAGVITYIVQLAMMGFASYMLYLGLIEASVRPQASLDLGIALFVVLCVLDMLLTDKADLHRSAED
jgi:hypothetical protein